MYKFIRRIIYDMERREVMLTLAGLSVVSTAGCAMFTDDDSGSSQASAESVTQTQPPSVDSVANVKNFGAKGDGAADDTAAITDALDYLNQEGGGTLFFPAGTYSVGVDPTPYKTFDLTKYPSIEIRGVGYASHIKVADGVAVGSESGVTVFYSGENCHIHNIRVNGNKSNQGTITDVADGANFVQLGGNSHMNNVWSVNSPGDGVEPFGDNVTIQNCIFRNNTEQDVHIWGSHCTVSGNVMLGNLKDGSIRVYSTADKGGDTRGHVISDNTIINPSTYGIQVQQSGAITKHSRIEGNVIINPGGSAGNADQNAGIWLNTLQESVVADNTVVNAEGDGIVVAPSGGKSRRSTEGIEIRSNSVSNCGGTGITVRSSRQPHIAGNTVKECGGRGIQFLFNGNNCPADSVKTASIKDNEVISNNQTDNGSAGILLYAANGELNNARVKRNEVIAPGSTPNPQHETGVVFNIGSGGDIGGLSLVGNAVKGTAENGGTFMTPDASKIASVARNTPRVRVDVRQFTNSEWGDTSYHDGSGTDNTEGEAQYRSDGSWVSLVDGSTIS